MQNLNGDWIIEIMSQPEWSDEVLDLLELCKLERVEAMGDYTQEFYIEKYDIELGFSEYLKSKKQKEKAEEGNLYFQEISFYKNCTIPLPFGLKLGDSRKVVRRKIYENAKILHLFQWDYIDNFLLEDKDKIYFFKPEYTDDLDKKLVDIVAFTWDTNMDLNKNYMKDKISIEEALKGEI